MSCRNIHLEDKKYRTYQTRVRDGIFHTYTSQTRSTIHNNMKTEGANVLATLLSDQMTL